MVHNAITCDVCGFECDACYVDSAWQFLCDICKIIEAHALEARTFNRTSTESETYDEWNDRTREAHNVTARIFAKAYDILESIERNTARVLATVRQ